MIKEREHTMAIDGYHRRAKKLLEECSWHLRHLSAAQELPIDCSLHRFKVLDRLNLWIKEIDIEIQNEEDESTQT